MEHVDVSAVLASLWHSAKNGRVRGPKHRPRVIDRIVFVVVGTRLTTGGKVTVFAERNRRGATHEVPSVAVYLDGHARCGTGRRLHQQNLALQRRAAGAGGF